MMMNAVDSVISEFNMFGGGGIVLCAVSGGADSMAMLHVLRKLSGKYNIDVRAAHFNHKLRGKESERDAEFVRAYCLEKGILFYSGGADVAKEAACIKKGIEETARILRYDFLDKTAAAINALCIATAHTASDNAETVLMNISRGAGLAGLCGIPPVRDNIVRPLIKITRPEIETYLKENAVAHIEDSSNADTRYSRNYIRHNVLPALEQKTPGVCGKILKMSGLLRIDREYLEKTAEKEFNNILLPGNKISAAGLNALHPAIASRVIKLFIAEYGTAPSYTDICGVMGISRGKNPSAKISLPGGIEVSRVYDALEVNMHMKDTPKIETRKIELDKITPVGGTNYEIFMRKANNFDIFLNSVDTFYVRCDNISGDILARTRMTGDTVRLKHGNGSKTLKKLFIDNKIPRALRDSVPVIADNNGVIAVYGFGVDIRCAAADISDALKIEIREVNNDG